MAEKDTTSSANHVATSPFKPNDEVRPQENVDTLLEQHKDAIAAVRKACPEIQEIAEFPFYDNIWFLRYMLSFKEVGKATEAAKKAFVWRQEYAEILPHAPRETDMSDALEGPMGRVYKILAQHQVAAVWDANAIADKGFLVLLRGAMGRPKAMFNRLTYEENIAVNFLYRESAYRHCDEMTRKTRFLTKQTLVFDVDGMKFSDIIDPQQQKVYGSVSKVSSYAYPQLIRKMCMVNSPKWMSIVVKIAKAFMPKSAVEKIEIFSSVEKMNRSEFGQNFLDLTKMPAYLGGSVTDLPPVLTGEFIIEDQAPMVQLKIPNRTAIPIKVAIAVPNATFELTALVENFGINFEITIEHGEYDSAAAEAAGDSESNDHDETSFYKLSGKTTVLKEHGKLKSEDGPTRQVFENIGPGIITITWDNQHSMFRNKNVQYLTNIDFEPGEKIIEAPELPASQSGGAAPN